MTHDEMIEVIKAHKEGKPIQIRIGLGWENRVGSLPDFNFHDFDYRVKPEPTTAYARVSDEGVVQSVNVKRDVVEHYRKKYGGRIIKLQEVEE